MKPLPLLAAFALGILPFTPGAYAHDRNPWHDVEKTLDNLNYRFHGLQTERERFGSSPRIREEMDRLRHGLESLTAITSAHQGKPDTARKAADNMVTLTEDIEEQYRDFARHGEVTHIARPY